MRLYHFSDRGDIDVFVPRAPLRRPDTEPLVYTMNEQNSPIYLFPRDCPRITTWVTEDTTPEDRELFYSKGQFRFKSYIDRSFEESWRRGSVYRYAFDTEGFEEHSGYGDWVSRKSQTHLGVEHVTDLPKAAEEQGMSVEIVDSLVDLGQRLHDYSAMKWTTTLHVSMIRMGLLPGWDH